MTNNKTRTTICILCVLCMVLAINSAHYYEMFVKCRDTPRSMHHHACSIYYAGYEFYNHQYYAHLVVYFGNQSTQALEVKIILSAEEYAVLKTEQYAVITISVDRVTGGMSWSSITPLSEAQFYASVSNITQIHRVGSL